METKEITLPSGAILKIQLAPFGASKALYQAVLEEIKAIKINSQDEIDVNLFKDVFCAGFSSKRIESTLAECMKRVLYNDKRISDDTWEPPEAREDYMVASFEVAKENLLPFMKSLSAQFAQVQAMLKSDPA